MNKWLFQNYQSKASNISIRKGNLKNQEAWGGGGGWLCLFRLSTLLNLSTTNSENWLSRIDIAGARTRQYLTNVPNSSQKSSGELVTSYAPAPFNMKFRKQIKTNKQTNGENEKKQTDNLHWGVSEVKTIFLLQTHKQETLSCKYCKRFIFSVLFTIQQFSDFVSISQ